MKRYSVRLTGLTITNYKNVVNGTLSFENPRKPFCASVLGLYGQNGSGKTVLIDALQLLKYVFSSTPLPSDEADWINVEAESSSFTYEFLLDRENGGIFLSYSFILRRENDESSGAYRPVICDEVIRCSSFSSGRGRIVRILDTTQPAVIGPQVKKNLFFAKENETDLIVTKKITFQQSLSFLFSPSLQSLIAAGSGRKDLSQSERDEIRYCSDLLESLVNYGKSLLFIVNSRSNEVMKIASLPGDALCGVLMLPLEESALVPERQLDAVERVIRSMNTVLTVLVPGLTLSIRKTGTEVMQSGENGSRIVLMRNRYSHTLPLKYESEGIKKIISILQLLIAVYNDDSVTVAVDELDCGIFEYLLGEIVRIISEKGKGQLIFTSHNLRPLETLDKGFVAFTTTNEEKRYIRLSNVKATNNLRDFYYRDIMLGGQNEKLYDETRSAEIAFAFREAGEENEA